MSALAERRVLVTRAAEDQAELAALLAARGARPVALPCIAFAVQALTPVLQYQYERLNALALTACAPGALRTSWYSPLRTPRSASWPAWTRPG